MCICRAPNAMYDWNGPKRVVVSTIKAVIYAYIIFNDIHNITSQYTCIYILLCTLCVYIIIDGYIRKRSRGFSPFPNDGAPGFSMYANAVNHTHSPLPIYTWHTHSTIYIHTYHVRIYATRPRYKPNTRRGRFRIHRLPRRQHRINHARTRSVFVTGLIYYRRVSSGIHLRVLLYVHDVYQLPPPRPWKHNVRLW